MSFIVCVVFKANIFIVIFHLQRAGLPFLPFGFVALEIKTRETAILRTITRGFVGDRRVWREGYARPA